MAITSVCGSQGSGKSLVVSAILLDDLQHGKRVMTNIELNIPKEWHIQKEQYVFVHTLQELLDLKPEGYIIALDEANLWADCRMSSKNMKISELVQQIRKKHNEAYFITQNFTKLEKRMREATEIYVQCTKFVLHNGEYIHVLNSEWLSPEVPVYIKVEKYFLDIQIPPKTYMIHANPLYNMYDSTQKQESTYG